MPRATGAGIVPFRIDVPKVEIKDLRDRLSRTRLSEAANVYEWS